MALLAAANPMQTEKHSLNEKENELFMTPLVVVI
jgi:hypothetical protein